MERQLAIAAVKGDVNEVKLLIAERVDVNVQDWEGYTALMKAARNGHVAVCQALLDGRADVNKMNSIGNTALHLACLNGYKDVVHLLINSGSDVNKRNIYGQTPSHCGASKGHVPVLEVLSTHGSDWTIRNSEGRDVLGEAQYNYKAAAVEFISRNGLQGKTLSITSSVSFTIFYVGRKTGSGQGNGEASTGRLSLHTL